MKENHPNISITVEEHLESYCNFSNSTERHKRLWHAWAHNKGWLERLLQWTLMSFPGYSMHDASHAESVLHNIEMLLGEEGIRQLSASDCFLILHTVFIHDIGMCITDVKRKEIMQDEKFIHYLKENHFDKKLLEYSEILLDRSGMPKPDNIDEEDYDSQVLLKKLIIYQAVIHVVSEFKRKTHAKDSKDTLVNWILDDNILGAGFSTSGIPLRLFLQVAHCAGVHNSNDFRDIMKLNKVDDGYVNDYVHPRFVAVMLQLGDTLDLDNDRFHPLIQQFMSDMPDSNYIHLGKHKSIRQLWISPKRITICADCENPNELRLVQREYEALGRILRNAKSEWIEIRPMDAVIILPDLKPLKLYLKGKEIESKFANMRFEIQQDKAFRLLQGGNFYKDRDVVFLREIFQNAVDATKLQIWKEWKNGLWNGDLGGEEARRFLDNTLSKQYPVEVDFYLAIEVKGEETPTVIYSIKQFDEITGKCNLNEVKYGVLAVVRDFGVGISSRDLEEISKTGTSMSRHDFLIDTMPEWMKPTAEFGIGLQSVFLVTDHFTAKTHVRHGEKFRIDFSGTGDRGDGRINVIPLDHNEVFQYGTEVSVFLDIDAVAGHIEKRYTWKGYDYFDNKTADRFLKFSRERIFRLANYLVENIKDPIVPIRITIHEAEPYNEYYAYALHNDSYGELWKSKTIKCSNGNDTVICRELRSQNWDREINQDEYEHIFKTERCEYKVNFRKGRLVLRNKTKDICACFSSANMLKLHSLAQKNPQLPEKILTKIYYKGVYVTSVHFGGDMDMLEYIDIKGGLDGNYLALNRADFTEEGKQYIRDVIYPRVIDDLTLCVNDLQQREYQGKKVVAMECDQLVRDISARKDVLQKHITTDQAKRVNEEMHKRIIFFACLKGFSNVQKRRSYYSRRKNTHSISAERMWETVFNNISKALVKDRNNSNESAFYNSYMYNIPTYDIKGGDVKKCRCNVIDVINCNADRYRKAGRKNYGYAIVSYREHYLDQWREYLFRIPESDMYNLRENIDRLRTASVTGEDSGNNRHNAEVEKILYDRIYRAVFDKDGKNRLKGISSIEDSKVDFVLLWVLDHMPSMAIFSECAKDVNIYDGYDRDLARKEDCRINILDTEQSDSIYFADRLKMDVFDRMRKKYHEGHSIRFATYTSTSFCQLGVNELPDDVEFVMRGRLGKIGCRKMIMPFTGDVIYKLFDENDNLDWKNAVILLESIHAKIDDDNKAEKKNRRECEAHFYQRIKAVMQNDGELGYADEMASLDEEILSEIADYAVEAVDDKVEAFYDGILRFCIEKCQALVNNEETENLTRYYSFAREEKERKRALNIKESLIQYVYDNRYIKELTKDQIEDYYEHYILDFLRIINDRITWRAILNAKFEQLREWFSKVLLEINNLD